MALQSDGSWSEFDDVTVEGGSQIEQDMIVNVTTASLYLLAANKVADTNWWWFPFTSMYANILTPSSLKISP